MRPLTVFAFDQSRLRGVALLILAVAVWHRPDNSQAQAVLSASQTAGPSTPPAQERGTPWRQLTRSQQAALKPLDREWSGIDATQKQKWLGIATRFPNLTPPEQARIQERMGEWVRLSAQQRGITRMNYQEAKQVPPQDRQARWTAYQALSPEQKQQLATRALAAPAPAFDPSRRTAPVSEPGLSGEPLQAKSNIVRKPALTGPPLKSIAPSVVQARPGATTTLVTTRPAPPSHQQPGLPKIAATPEFVDKATLLPQKGPQGAGPRPPAPWPGNVEN